MDIDGNNLRLSALLAANLASRLGNTLAAIAIPWYVLETTGSPAGAGVAAFFGTVPLALGAFFGGAVADRLGRTRASALGDVLSGFAVAGIAVLHTADLLGFWALVALAFAGALFDAPAEAARQALVPELAGHAGTALERANSLYTSTEHAGYVLGAPLAGVLIAWLGPVSALWIDAAMFAASALTVVAAVGPTESAARGRSYVADLADGLRFIRTDAVVLMFLVMPAVGSLIVSPLATVVLPVYARSALGGARDLGLLVGAYGLGGMAGAAWFALLGPRLARRTLYVGAAFTSVALFAVLVSVPPLTLALPTLFFIGAAAGALVPLEATVRQERTPPVLHGRVFATVKAAVSIPVPLGLLGGGVLLEVFGLRQTFLVLALLNAAAAVVTASLPSGRRLDDTRRPTESLLPRRHVHG